MSTLESYCQAYTYNTGNNLTHLSHQAHSSTWQQTLTIHPNNNRGTETQQSTTDFNANGNLLTLNNIGTLHWYYNNTLNQLTKADKSNTTQYYVYNYRGRRVRTVIESNNQVQHQRDYLPSLDISINKAKQQTSTLHIGTHILSEISKDNTQSHSKTRYQLTSHLQSSTLECNDKAQTLSYEHYYPYGSTAIIAGKDKTQVQQKRYRYTGKERDDSSGLCYYGARYLAPWLTRWISPDSAGAVDGLNLYVYVGNNPLKYRDPTGHVKTKIEQENAEEGAIGGINNIAAIKLDAGEYVKAEESALSLDLKMERIKAIQQEILQSDIFKKLGELKSSTRLHSEGRPYEEVDDKINMLRSCIISRISDIEKTHGVSRDRAAMRFTASDEFKDMLFKQYKVGNCGESSDVMIGELNKNYPKMIVENVSIETPDHVFNVLNRDQSTSIFNPEKWNDDSLVVDPWKRTVYTKQEFLLVNSPANFYGLNDRIQGETEIIVQHNESVISFLLFEGLELKEEETIL
ncbi:hypothetical protein BSPCLSOX_2559 [uncultured Gammaproteobacteria bacterium]|nr:hypothetical protein BSPCLSOX_2559 [uncultured Gammaproteobacteria bacterium]